MFSEIITVLEECAKQKEPFVLETPANTGSLKEQEPHLHEAWEIKFYPDRILLIAPGVIHAATYDHSGVLYCEKEKFTCSWGKRILISQAPLPAGIPLPGLLDFFSEHSGAVLSPLRQSLTRTLLSALRCLFQELPAEHPPKETAQALRDYLEKYYFRPELSIGDAAAFLGCSPQYLSRKCQQKWGCSARHLLVNIRLEHARKLLASGSFLVSDAARLTGWRCPFYFSNTFRKTYGYSPRQESSK